MPDGRAGCGYTAVLLDILAIVLLLIAWLTRTGAP